MKRLPPFAVSLVLHAGVITVALLAPVIPEPPDDASAPPPLTLPAFVPVGPRVALAAPPRSAPARARRPVSDPRVAEPRVAPVLPTEDTPPDAPIADAGPAGVDLSAHPRGEGACLENCDPAAPPDPPGAGQGAASGGGGGSPLPVGGTILAPRRLNDVMPQYPEIARRARVSGTVEIECVIDTRGFVVDARVVSGHVLLREAALEAVRRWRYAPTTLNGAPVAVAMSVTVRFGIR
jgi:protein TonB